MEKLYNGIVLPDVWPPQNTPDATRDPIPVPYLDKANKPDTIDISVGRQLFVDDFLVAKCNLQTIYHQPEVDGTPIFEPEKPWEKNRVCTVSGGVWYDKQDQLFKMWYSADWFYRICYATSKDGINWERPDLGEGNNIAVHDREPDYTTVWIDDEEKDPNKRYKMFFRRPDSWYKDGLNANQHKALLFYSADGMHFDQVAQTDGLGDASTIFYNPFRKKWVYSMRISELKSLGTEPKGIGRHRYYRECDDLIQGAHWESEPHAAIFWQRADCLDKSDPKYNDPPEIYDINCNAYESIMLGSFMILEGPSANISNSKWGIPKNTEIFMGFSRDGFHFSRPSREAFIPCTGRMGDMNQGYMHLSGGVCIIVDDELWFYYSGYSSRTGTPGSGYDYASIGLAKLRRDGFASVEGDGELTTEALTVSGNKKYFFVNVNGEVRAELLDEHEHVIPGYSLAECTAFVGDSTKQQLSWQGKDDISFLNNAKFHIRFQVKGALYAFWLSDQEDGRSNGYLAAGCKGS